MSNKDLESLYEKILLRESGEDIKDVSDEEEYDILNDEDPLDEDDDKIKDKAHRELIAAIHHLMHRWDNVVDGARSEKDFLKTLQQLMPEIKAILNKI
jgi:hypothetical protein